MLLAAGAGAALIAAGLKAQARPPYDQMAGTLIGGGWTTLYITAYGAAHFPATKVIDSPSAGIAVLLAVAAGMIGHALSRRSRAMRLYAVSLTYFVMMFCGQDVTFDLFLILFAASAAVAVGSGEADVLPASLIGYYLNYFPVYFRTIATPPAQRDFNHFLSPFAWLAGSYLIVAALPLIPKARRALFDEAQRDDRGGGAVPELGAVRLDGRLDGARLFWRAAFGPRGDDGAAVRGPVAPLYARALAPLLGRGLERDPRAGPARRGRVRDAGSDVEAHRLDRRLVRVGVGRPVSRSAGVARVRLGHGSAHLRLLLERRRPRRGEPARRLDGAVHLHGAFVFLLAVLPSLARRPNRMGKTRDRDVAARGLAGARARIVGSARRRALLVRAGGARDPGGARGRRARARGFLEAGRAARVRPRNLFFLRGLRRQRVDRGRHAAPVDDGHRARRLRLSLLRGPGERRACRALEGTGQGGAAARSHVDGRGRRGLRRVPRVRRPPAPARVGVVEPGALLRGARAQGDALQAPERAAGADRCRGGGPHLPDGSRRAVVAARRLQDRVLLGRLRGAFRRLGPGQGEALGRAVAARRAGRHGLRPAPARARRLLPRQGARQRPVDARVDRPRLVVSGRRPGAGLERAALSGAGPARAVRGQGLVLRHREHAPALPRGELRRARRRAAGRLEPVRPRRLQESE